MLALSQKQKPGYLAAVTRTSLLWNACTIAFPFPLVGQTSLTTLTLSSSVDVASGGAVCPNISPVEFTCVAVQVIFLEWRINTTQIGSLTLNEDEGRVFQTEKFAFSLEKITVSNNRANMTSRLVVDISNLANGDQIICISEAQVQDTETINYTVRSKSGSGISLSSSNLDVFLLH